MDKTEDVGYASLHGPEAELKALESSYSRLHFQADSERESLVRALTRVQIEHDELTRALDRESSRLDTILDEWPGGLDEIQSAFRTQNKLRVEAEAKLNHRNLCACSWQDGRVISACGAHYDWHRLQNSVSSHNSIGTRN